MRFTIMAILIMSYFLLCGINYPVLYFFPTRGRRNTGLILYFISKIALKALRIKVTTQGKNNIVSPRLLTCNHLSYLDVLIIASKIPTCFVTSVEVKNTPFLGHLVRITGCLFVERRSKDNLGKEVAEIEHALAENLNVLFFPEATSHNGTELLRFRRPLFNASITTKIPVLPLCLNYLSIDGEEVNERNRDFLFWYGDMTFWEHYKNLFKLKDVKVELVIGKSLRDSSIDNLVKSTYEVTINKFRPILS